MSRSLFSSLLALSACFVTVSVTPTVSAQEAAPRKFEVENNKLKLPAAVVFETGSDKLKSESDAALNHVKAYLDEKTYITLMRVEVHSDNSGNETANQKLTEQRALAVTKWLTGKGIDCKRLIPVGFGSTKPIAANNTAEGKAQNRRSDFINAALRGRPIGGMPVDGGGVVAGDPCQ